MEVLTEVYHLYHIWVIDGIFISLLVVKLLSYLLNKEIYAISKNILRWLVIVGGVINILEVANPFASNKISLIVNAPWFYLIMIFILYLLPFTLLINKVKDKGWAIFIIGVVINGGWFFEQFVIKIISNHIDYRGASGTAWSISFLPIDTLTNGILQGVFIAGISVIIVKYRNATN